MTYTFPFEFPLLDWFQTIRNTPLDYFMITVSTLYNAGIFAILLAILLLAMPKHRREGAILALSLICMLLVVNIFIKNVVARQRPYWLHPEMLEKIITAVPSDYSFPSGHTSASFTAATAIFFSGKKRFGICLYLLAVCVAISRLYLYIHFPTDVLAGMIIGILMGLLGNFLFKKIEKIYIRKKQEEKANV